MLPTHPTVPRNPRRSPAAGSAASHDPWETAEKNVCDPSRSNKLNYSNEKRWTSLRKINPEETHDQKTIRTFTADIAVYKYVPFLFMIRAASFVCLGHSILAIGDCIKAIKLLEIALGLTDVPGLSIIDAQMILDMNATYCSENLVEGSEDFLLAMDFRKLTRDAGSILLEAASAFGANPDSLEDTLKSVFDIVPEFRETCWADYMDNFLATTMTNEEAKEGIERLKEKGREWTAVMEWMNEDSDHIELSRERRGLETVYRYQRTVDSKMLVCPMVSKELYWEDGEQGGTTHLGMIAQTDIPAKGKISHDKTDLVIQDTANNKPPYRCDNCWKFVTEFGPGKGMVCCFHATRGDGNAAWAPTVYCNDTCKFENRKIHDMWHQAITNTAYEAASKDNDFPLFVAKVYTMVSRGPVGHPLTLLPMICTLCQFGSHTRYWFSIKRDLIDPWNTGLEMKFDIFGDPRWETWVLLSLKNKWENNKRIKSGLKLVFPIRAMYNHSCDSNAIVAKALIKSGTKRTKDNMDELPVNEEVVYARKEIKKGEEVLISYIGGGAARMQRKARALSLKPVGIRYCECLFCYGQREKEAEKKQRRKK